MAMEDFGISPVLIFWMTILLIVFIVSLFRYLNRSSKYRMIERLAERGQQISPEMLSNLTNGNGRSEPKSPVSSGIFLMCVGIALAVFFWGLGHWGNPFAGEQVSWLVVIGIFPFMVGLARLIGGMVDRRQDDK